MAHEFAEPASFSSPRLHIGQPCHRDTSNQAVTTGLEYTICIMGPAWVECRYNELGYPVVSFLKRDRSQPAKSEFVMSPPDWEHKDAPRTELPKPAAGEKRSKEAHPRMKELWKRVLAERQRRRAEHNESELALSSGSSTDDELSPASDELVVPPLAFTVGRRAELVAFEDEMYPVPPPPPSPMPTVVPASWPRPVPMRLRMPQPVRPRDIPRTRVLEELAESLTL